MDRSAGRSASLHVGSENTNKVKKEDRFSASSSRFHWFFGGSEEAVTVKSGENSSSQSSCKASSPTLTKRLGQGLMNGLRKAFGVRTAFHWKEKADGDDRGLEFDNEDVLVIKEQVA